MTSPKSDTSSLSGDHPRLDPADDLLGYAPFAKMLAHSVLRGSPSEGLVVGLYGEWGLGKTSLLNFIEHYVKADADDDPPIIVRFNPWWFSAREDLLRRFFREFQVAVLKDRNLSEKVREGIRKLGEVLSAMPTPLAPSAGRVVAMAANLGEPPDLIGVKEELSQALAARALRVVVLIDDIDRLLPAEMVDIFRLVRSVGDFPNVHYVLAFDRKVVAGSLTDACHTDGDRYLEKIIQAPFDLPRPGTSALHAMFTSRLDKLLEGTDETLFDAQYWQDVFLRGIAPFLKTPRDVIRLTNSIAVIYPSVRNDVNPVDFIAIEALRIFAPNAHEVIRSNPDRFVGLLLSVQHRHEELKNFHERWLEGTPTNKRAIRALVLRLFPAVGALLSKTAPPSPRSAALRKMRRICTDRTFERYFRYTIGGELPRAAFLETLEADASELKGILERYHSASPDSGNTRLRSFLEALSDELELRKVAVRSEVLQALCAIGDTVAQTPRSLTFEVPTHSLLLSVVRRAVRQAGAPQRVGILMAALKAAGVSTLARLVVTIGAENGRYDHPRLSAEERTLESDDDLATVEQYARQRLAHAAQDRSLWRAPQLGMLLFDWRRLEGGQAVRESLARWVATETNVVEFLRCMTTSASNGQKVLELGSIAELASVDLLASAARTVLAAPNLELPDQTLLQRFLDSYAATEGERAESTARTRVLDALLECIANTGWYPTMHQLRTQFAEHRATINRLSDEKCIAQVVDKFYMILLPGLAWNTDNPVAKRELYVASLLLERLQTAYTSGHAEDPTRLALSQLQTELVAREATLQLNDLRRATLVLMQLGQASGRGSVGIQWKDGLPDEVIPMEHVLDFSSEDIRNGKS